MHATLSSPRISLRAVQFAAALLFSFGLSAAPAQANSKYAGYVYDVNAGKALYADQATEQRYPASLTKIMTCYIIFEELAAGRLKFGTEMVASKYAAGRPPSKIGFRPGQSIAVRDAIKALVTKSANDVAVIVAEHIEGSEAAFARRMTETAKRIGMTDTVFRNANGLPNAGQHTTAVDMTQLGIAIQRDFPQYYGVFQTRVFQYGKRRYGNHNKLLGRVEGVDGIKTGYINASGFNLVTSVRRDGKHLVAVVMGGRTGASRNKHMKELIARFIPKATVGTPLPVFAFNDAEPAPTPLAKPSRSVLFAARVKAKEDDGDAIADQLLAFAASARTTIAAPAATEVAAGDTLRSVIAEARGAGLPAPAPLPSAAETMAARSGANEIIAVAVASEKDGSGAEDAPRGDRRVELAFATFTQDETDTVGRQVLLSAITRARDSVARSLKGDATTILAGSSQAAPAGELDGRAALEAKRRRIESPVLVTQVAAATDPSGWQIQVGAVGSPHEAAALLSSAAKVVPAVSARQRVTLPVATERGTLYRARFAGFATKREANETCKRFANHNRPCWAVSM
ncbi:D-alanyl-D-alanine carboxypeptidase family protein [Acuticoccus sp. MNP-M23]|uniref:D-alanyl-D-alanine carboxypeptidase family protein n=1 Tax=Acuticoccus sp. MNP-M23 TaxID=3072793 RepID=UPI0028169061|nr:D-alanyl-D-alanine carboxypeptidase family protein [Acuticoccus sp. MNP-M23]WMS42858.1 D-alanyl-D-alanine carboxypeptidase family protein [Acuticoccus sp. MNP-M23]